MAEKNLAAPDIAVIVIYFIAIIAVGIIASIKAKRTTVKGYFLADRSIPFFAVGASLFVSNIGSEHFIGLAGSGAASGIGVAAWEFNALFFIQLLGFVFVPVYIASKAYTMPEYTNIRFGGQRIRVYYATLSLLLYIFTKCSVNLYTGAIFIQQALGWNIYTSIIVQIGIVALLTITGGLTAVMYTDVLQAILMVGGALALMGKGFYEIGGLAELWRKYPQAIVNLTVENTTCHEINPNWDVLLREPSDPEMPWPGFIFGQSPASIWYWCADQVIVQRTLAAKNLSHAQAGALMAGLLKLLPLFMMVMPGMMARVLYTEEVACVDPNKCMEVCQSRSSCTNIAYPKLVLGIMPVGAKGTMMAVMLAALMSDLDSIFNSASTMFTIDIYQRIRRNAGKTELMLVGRLFVVLMVGVAVAWVPVVQATQGGQLFIYIQEISAYLSPPVACVFLLSVFWPGCNEKGAFFGLMTGLVMGLTRLVLVLVYRGPQFCGDVDNRPSFITQFHYMYFAIVLFWSTALVTISVSLATDPPSFKQVYRTTYWTRHYNVSREDLKNDTFELDWKFLRCFCSMRKVDVCKVSEETKKSYENPAFVSAENLGNKSEEYCEVESKNEDEKSNMNCSEVQTRQEVSTQETLDTNSFIQNPEKKYYSSTTMDEPQEIMEQKHSSCIKRFLCDWVCGISLDGGSPNEYEITPTADELKRRLEEEEIEEEEQILEALQQRRSVKIALYIGSLFIISVAVFMFVFLSVWRWNP